MEDDIYIWRIALISAAIGFAVGVVVGFEWGWQPVIDNFRPLIG